ncbi:MAG TPA: dihydroxyacetone kinase subunit DhaL [Microbacteriaceae bacterium]|nr:dihydroxyacetone kinase subunit DhaL [Microbacteriaceae bacterium]
MRRFSAEVTSHKERLTELDSAIGDADHGTNMARGFQAVVGKLDESRPEAIDAAFKSVGMTLVSTVGGASGPLYGTFFLRFAQALGPTSLTDAAGLGAALRAGLGGVVARGKAVAEDKTMYDAMAPACDAFDAAVAEGAAAGAAASAAADAADRGRDATLPLVARKGRASYLGDRSAGHLDPGATSTALLFHALADALNA